MNEDTARCCSVLCPDGGSCSLQYSHTGEHYSTQELLLDIQNPDRHEVKRLRKEKAEALAANAEMRRDAEIARLKRALAAGPAALRKIAAHAPGPAARAAEIVEAAQEAAMKEGK